MRKLNDEQWRALGDQVKKTRIELFKLSRMASGCIPKVTHTLIIQAIKKLDSFKAKAEARMFEQNCGDEHVFYGDS